MPEQITITREEIDGLRDKEIARLVREKMGTEAELFVIVAHVSLQSVLAGNLEGWPRHQIETSRAFSETIRKLHQHVWGLRKLPKETADFKTFRSRMVKDGHEPKEIALAVIGMVWDDWAERDKRKGWLYIHRQATRWIEEALARGQVVTREAARAEMAGGRETVRSKAGKLSAELDRQDAL